MERGFCFHPSLASLPYYLPFSEILEEGDIWRVLSLSILIAIEGLSFDSTDKEEWKPEIVETRRVFLYHSTLEPDSNKDEVSFVKSEAPGSLEQEKRVTSIPTETESQKAGRGYRIYDTVLPHTISGDVDSTTQSTIKKGGLSELSSIHDDKHILTENERSNYVPSEVTVTKYGYITHRVIAVLDNILDYGGFFSTATRKSVSFDHIEMSQNGRDINILYHIHKFSHDDSVLRSLSVEEEEEFDNIRCLLDVK